MAKTFSVRAGQVDQIEAEPYIPFKHRRSESLSFSILGETSEKMTKPRWIRYWSAAKKDSVDLRIELLREAGLSPGSWMLTPLPWKCL